MNKPERRYRKFSKSRRQRASNKDDRHHDRPKRTNRSPVASKPKETRRYHSMKPIQDDFPPADSIFDVAVLDRESGDNNFGWGRMHFTCLRWCRSPWAFLICLCILKIAGRFGISGVFAASITQLERQFHVTGTEIVLIRLAYDVGFLLTLIPFLFVAAKVGHRPQWISVGGLLVTMGTFICTFAHFLFASHSAASDRATCASPSPDVCSNPPPKTAAIFFFALGFFLVGVGNAPAAVLGITYLDEYVSHATSAICTGVLAAFDLVGPAFGFGLTSAFGRFASEEATRNRRFGVEGAWTSAMVINGIIAFVGALWISAFPERLRGSSRACIMDIRRALAIGEQENQVADTSSWIVSKIEKEQKRMAVKGVLKNATFWALMVEQCSRSATTGTALFVSKYLQTVLGAGSARANFISAAVGIFAALAALFFVVLFQLYFRLRVTGNLRLALMAAVGTLIFSGIFAIKAPPKNIAGVTRSYFDQHPDVRNLTAPCNLRCKCTTEFANPICFNSDDGNDVVPVQYFSWCHAGCNSSHDTNGTNCKCVSRGGKTKIPVEKLNDLGKICVGEHHVGNKPCHMNLRIAFSIGLVWFAFSIFVRLNPVEQAILRGVPSESRLIAVIISSGVQCLFSSLIGGLTMASLLDKWCLEWETRCGKNVVCVWHDRAKLPKYMLIIMIVFSTISVLALLVALIVRKKSSKSPDETTFSKSPSTLSDFVN